MGRYTVVGKENSWFVGALSPINHMGGGGGRGGGTSPHKKKHSLQ